MNYCSADFLRLWDKHSKYVKSKAAMHDITRFIFFKKWLERVVDKVRTSTR